MAEPEQQKYRDDDSATFIEEARNTARMNGACVLEFFTCPNPECAFQQVAAHAFREVVCCCRCNQRMASVVPRLDQPGEVTKWHLQFAIDAIKRVLPQVDDETIKWMERQEGAAKVMAAAYGALTARRALDQVEAMAREMTGAHKAP